MLPGNDAAAPGVDPARDYLSAYLVPAASCSGSSRRPGCLSQFVNTYANPGSLGASTAPSVLQPLLNYLLGR